MRIFLAGQPQAGSGHEEELKEAFHCANDDLFSESGTQINFIRPAHKLKFDRSTLTGITFLLLLALFKVRFSISSVSFGRSRKPRDFELRSILDQFFDTAHGSEVLAQRRAERGAPSGRVWPPDQRNDPRRRYRSSWGQRREPGSGDARP